MSGRELPAKAGQSLLGLHAVAAMVATLGAIGAGYAAAAITPTNEPNMNGEHLLSPTPWPPTPKWSTSFKDHPRRRRVLHGVRGV